MQKAYNPHEQRLKLFTALGLALTLTITTPAAYAQVSCAPPQTLPVGSLPNSITHSDLDGDGDNDLVVSNEFSSTVSVLLNKGNGSFAAAITLPVGNEPQAVAVGDLDGDGDLDLTVASQYTIGVQLNNLVGGVTSAQLLDAVQPRDIDLVNLDGDGDLDIVTANFGSNSSFSNTVSLIFNLD